MPSASWRSLLIFLMYRIPQTSCMLSSKLNAIVPAHWDTFSREHGASNVSPMTFFSGMRGLLRHQVLMSGASAIFGLSIVSCFTSQLYFSTFFTFAKISSPVALTTHLWKHLWHTLWRWWMGMWVAEMTKCGVKGWNAYCSRSKLIRNRLRFHRYFCSNWAYSKSDGEMQQVEIFLGLMKRKGCGGNWMNIHLFWLDHSWLDMT